MKITIDAQIVVSTTDETDGDKWNIINFVSDEMQSICRTLEDSFDSVEVVNGNILDAVSRESTDED